MCVCVCLRRYGKQFDCAFQTKNKILFSLLFELHNKKIKSQALRKIEKSINRIDFFAGRDSWVGSQATAFCSSSFVNWRREREQVVYAYACVCVFVFHADATYTHTHTPTRTSSRKCKRTHIHTLTHTHAHVPARPGAPLVNTLAVNWRLTAATTTTTTKTARAAEISCRSSELFTCPAKGAARTELCAALVTCELTKWEQYGELFEFAYVLCN